LLVGRRTTSKWSRFLRTRVCPNRVLAAIFAVGGFWPLQQLDLSTLRGQKFSLLNIDKMLRFVIVLQPDGNWTLYFKWSLPQFQKKNQHLDVAIFGEIYG
jgi:hypothetical protein